MDLQTLLNLFDAILVVGVAVPSLVLAFRIKQPRLRVLTGLLAGFLLVHGAYHGSFAAASLPGLDVFATAADVVIEPAGWLLFFAFTLYLLRSSE